ncbi:MAG: glutamyl-tRNA reductase [Gammaproteobacteria bacterium]|nr:glutamyl-tRNA reductase [Gammaproteobacteria bacterium]
MSLTVLGINHNSAAVEMRERVAFAPEQLVEALQEACQHAGLQELVILSTCNRTELYFTAQDQQTDFQQRALQWLATYHHQVAQDIGQSCYEYCEEEALRHMIQVASGLDSMVLGEPQILGQMKSAYAVAEEAGTVGTELARVFPRVFSVAKKVRTDTAIGENPVSVAYAAVNLAGHIFTDLATTQALLVGAGETIELVAKHLAEAGVKRIVVANRTLGRARELAQRFGVDAVLLADIPAQLEYADIVITSTASQLPILGKGAVEHALKLRKHRPILMVDIAVPRDIEPQVGELRDVYLYSVDDLREIVDQNRRSRRDEARKADQLIEAGIHEYQHELRSRHAVDTVKALRLRAEGMRDVEIERALRALARGEEAEQVITALARGLTNKLIHSPSIELKRASAEGREEALEIARQLLGLQDNTEG